MLITGVAGFIGSHLLSVRQSDEHSTDQIHNTLVGDCISLNALFRILRDALEDFGVSDRGASVYCVFRLGDMRHSQVEMSKVGRFLGYGAKHSLESGIKATISLYADKS